MSHRSYQALSYAFQRKRLLSLPVLGTIFEKGLSAAGKRRGLGYDFEDNLRLLLAYAKFDRRVATMLRDLEASDVLIANVEGDGIFTPRPRRQFLLMMTLAHYAQQQNKPVYFVNGMFSEDPRSGINERTISVSNPVFEASRVVTVRENESYRFAQRWFPLVNTKAVPDALYAWQPNIELISKSPRDRSALWPYYEMSNWSPPPIVQEGRYIAIGGSSAAAWNPKRAKPHYEALTQALKKLGQPLVLVQTCEGDAFLEDVAKEAGVPFIPVNIPVMAGAAVLARAEVFVSGHWHPSIMATLGGTPCVFLGSNSHKTRSLQEQIGYASIQEYSAVPTGSEIDEIVQDVEGLLADPSRRNVILAKARELSTEAASLPNLLA